MLTLAATDTFSGGASVASQVTCTVFGMELTAGPTETYKILYQGQLGSSAAALITVAASTTDFIKSIHVVNNDTVARTAQFFVNIGGTGVAAADAITPAIAVPAGGMAIYEDGQGWSVYDSNGNLATKTVANPLTVLALNADLSNSTTTVAEVTGLTIPCGVGTFQFHYVIRYQAAATTTGIKFAVDHTGTVTSLMADMLYVDNLATASSGAADQDANASTAQVYGAYAARADNVTLGPTLSVDTAGSDMMIIIDGMLVCTVAGQLRLMHGSEVAAATTVKAGSSVILTQVG